MISDVHLGPTIGAEFMEDVVKRLNALSPDVIAIAGELGADEHPSADHRTGKHSPGGQRVG